ncbi:MAG: Tex family protein [Halanaerobiales bacterium]
MSGKIISHIAEENSYSQKQIKAVIKLLDEGNTVPFIARYRKEMTGSLTEEEIRDIKEKLNYLRKLEKRKREVIRLIAEQDKLTDELKKKIENTKKLQEIEDLYRPYRPKRETRASKAKNKGLEPLAKIFWEQERKTSVQKLAKKYLNPENDLDVLEDVLNGARDIIAEWISDDADIRKDIRAFSYKKGVVKTEVRNKGKDERKTYQLYYDYEEKVSSLPPHRILAINRGEKEEILRVKILVDEEKVHKMIEEKTITDIESPYCEQIKMAIKDAYKRLIGPSIEREIRNHLTEKAEKHAIQVFGKNLRSLLLQPPYKGHVVMGIDPAFRTGSKVCVVDEMGELLDVNTIYPHPPQSKREEAEETIKKMVEKHNVDSIAIGNGTASRETEYFIADLIKDGVDVKYIIVNEAGASVYSASELAREELPKLDVSMRGAVSIARRLQDPLAELVKINPRSIGVGLYQHDINEKSLEQSLKKVVESVVNYVGVDVNTASPALLKYVAGINSNVAHNIVEHRRENGPFRERRELKDVYRLGPKTFKQSAGFIRIFSNEDPLACTPIHPESYSIAKKLLAELDFEIKNLTNSNKLNDLKELLSDIDLCKKADNLRVGLPTLKDIIKALKKPGRDPREELPRPIFREDILKIEDLKTDMVLQGTVRNVVDFGAFVDIGVKEDGLVHISEMSHEYVENPLDYVQVGDIIQVKIIEVDQNRKRISLSMKL